MPARKKPWDQLTYQEKCPYIDLPPHMKKYLDAIDRSPLSSHGKEFAKEYVAVAYGIGNQADILLFLEQNAHCLTQGDCRFLGSSKGSELLSGFGHGYRLPVDALRKMGEGEHITPEVVKHEVWRVREEFHRLVDLQGGDFEWFSEA